MLTIFAVHESVEGERRLRAVRTDYDNFRCRALHPRLPEKRTQKIFPPNLSMMSEGRRGVHPGSARQGGEWLSVDRRAVLCVHAHLLARDTPCRAPTKRARAHTPAFSQPSCTLAVVPAVGPSEQRPRDTVPRMTWGTHAQMQVGTALQQVCR